MRFTPSLAAFLRNLCQRRRVERDLAEEVDSYLALSAERKMRDGLEPGAARREAATEFGGVEQVKEEVREVRLGHFLEMRLQDLRFAVRTLRKSPVFSLTVIFVLALGLGSTALMFTLVNSALIEGPPFPDSSQLFMLWGKIPAEPQISFSPQEFAAWQKQTQSFASLAAFTGSGFTIYGRGEPELVVGQMVTPALFTALRIAPALGRAFLEAEAQPGRDHVVILSDDLWRGKFGARRDILGEPVDLDGEFYTVVGVMPPGFDFPTPQVKVWAPLALAAPFFHDHQDAHLLRVLGRLKPGTTAEQLSAETGVIGPRVLDPSEKSGRLFYSLSLQDQTNGELRTPLLVLLGSVSLLLALACANVTNLMLARGKARTSEMAVRAALGASRQRLVAQLLTESALLTAVGALAGFALAFWSLELLRNFATDNLPQLLHAHLDGRVAFFVLLTAGACGMFFGLGPALRASGSSLAAVFGGGTRSTIDAVAARSRSLLVFAEVALAAVLLIGCALMMRSFLRLATTSPGFAADDVITANAIVSVQRYPGATQMLSFYRSALEKITNLPGISAAGLVTHLPFAGNSWGNSIEIAGRATAGQNESANIRGVSPGYFATLLLPLLQGRDFTERDNAQTAGVAIVSEQFARRYWPNESPLGQRVRYDRHWLTVVGVCGDVKHNQLDEEPDRTVYVAYVQMAPAVLELVGRDLHFVVRSTSAASATSGLRLALRALDPELVVKVDSMTSLINQSLAQPRFRTGLIAIFALFALTLSALGIYGVIAYLVTQRYKEIGVRLALGATRSNILRLILGGTLKLAAAATAAGLCAAYFLSRFLSTMLYGVTAHDALTFLTVPCGLIAIALIAGLVPALRATRIDPVRSLRYE
ncbi:MAG: ADOP family duplicated permease [Chthoniobacterales bacterium]